LGSAGGVAGCAGVLAAFAFASTAALSRARTSSSRSRMPPWRSAITLGSSQAGKGGAAAPLPSSSSGAGRSNAYRARSTVRRVPEPGSRANSGEGNIAVKK